jgi:hypothetical protein
MTIRRKADPSSIARTRELRFYESRAIDNITYFLPR